MTTPTTHDDPLELANECTVEDIRRWMRAWAEQMTARQMTVPDSARVHMQALLDGLWEGEEPEPTPHELVALLSLTEMMGETQRIPPPSGPATTATAICPSRRASFVSPVCSR